VVTLYLAVASLRTDLVLTVIIWLIFAVLAWYHAAGDIIESTFGRKVLPFGPPPLK